MEECIPRAECRLCQEKYDEVNNGQNKRLDHIEEEIKQIHELATAVGKMAMSLEQMAKELAKQGERLDRIEAEPATKWKNAVWLLTAGLIGAVLSFVLGRMGL